MEKLKIKETTTIIEAMSILDATSEKVLLVVDQANKLLGTMTDGDLRRHILKSSDLKGDISSAYKKEFIYFKDHEFDPIKAKATLKEKVISLIPIVDDEGRLVDYFSWNKLHLEGGSIDIEVTPLDVPVVIMAGGKGTRLEPFTHVLPKPLIPVKGTPIIEHIILRFKKYGLSNFLITVQHKSNIIRAYFEEQSLDYSLKFIKETQPLGTAGSLSLMKEELQGPFFVSNCDIIVDADYVDLYEFHQKHKYDITLVASLKDYHIPYGTCVLNEEGCLSEIVEKPNFNFLVNTGLYVLNSSVLELIPPNEVFHMTHLIEKVMKNNGRIGVFPVSERSWVDIGQWSEYKRALSLLEGCV
ncbi:MAG: nucleotidyltransferase family protein [Bacteriovoracaceae bacterium]